MQEEVEQKVVLVMTNCAKLTEQELRRAISLVLQQSRSRAAQKDRTPHGKITVKELAAQGKGMESIEVTDQNIGSFCRVARKYGIDFAPFKVKDENKYLVFFKSPDTDAMTAAFKEYTAKQVKKASRPSVLAKLRQYAELMQNTVRDRVKHKEHER